MKKRIPTQIYLSNKLRSEIDEIRRDTGESLSAYIRKAVQERLRKANKQLPIKDLKIISL